MRGQHDRLHDIAANICRSGARKPYEAGRPLEAEAPDDMVERHHDTAAVELVDGAYPVLRPSALLAGWQPGNGGLEAGVR